MHVLTRATSSKIRCTLLKRHTTISCSGLLHAAERSRWDCCQGDMLMRTHQVHHFVHHRISHIMRDDTEGPQQVLQGTACCRSRLLRLPQEQGVALSLWPSLRASCNGVSAWPPHLNLQRYCLTCPCLMQQLDIELETALFAALSFHQIWTLTPTSDHYASRASDCVRVWGCCTAGGAQPRLCLVCMQCTVLSICSSCNGSEIVSTILPVACQACLQQLPCPWQPWLHPPWRAQSPTA